MVLVLVLLNPTDLTALPLFTGFTKWSASRTPVEVFELLETLYREFDSIALWRRVFKVETVRALWGLLYVCT